MQWWCVRRRDEGKEKGNAMVMKRKPERNEADQQAVERTNELMHEFRAHFEEVVKAHPELAEKVRVVFEGWAIQKIAGLQLCVEHIAEQHNLHLKAHEGF